MSPHHPKAVARSGGVRYLGTDRCRVRSVLTVELFEHKAGKFLLTSSLDFHFHSLAVHLSNLLFY